MSLALLMAGFSFDASQVAPSVAGQVLPAGWFKAQIDNSEMKPTKDGQGRYLELRFSIIDGKFNNSKVFARLNVENANPETKQYAYADLSAICHSVGVIQFQDTQQLHAKPMHIKLKVRPASGDYEASNDVNGFKSITEQIKLCDEAYGAGAGAGAPGYAQPGAQQAQPFAMQQPVAPIQQQPTQQAPTQQAPAQQQQVAQPWQQPAQQQPIQQQPVQQPVDQSQQQQVQQPWAAQQQGAPVQQQAPVEQQPVQQQQVQQPTQQQAPQQAQTVQQPWAQQVIDPNAAIQQAVQPQQQQQAAPEQQHQAQTATPPWMQAAQAPVQQ